MITQTPSSTIVNRVAWSIQQRAAAQAWRGKKGDGLALEAACGALAACIAINGDEHPTTHALSMFAFLVSTRGIAVVHERAAQHQPQENAA